MKYSYGLIISDTTDSLGGGVQNKQSLKYYEFVLSRRKNAPTGKVPVIIEEIYIMKKQTFRSLTTLMIMFSLHAAHAAQPIQPVVGGQNVAAQDVIAESTVGILMKMTKGAGICSGEIIDSSHILAAAHCLNGFQGGYVVFSTGDITTILKSNPGVARKITAVKAMPGYSGQTSGSEEFADFSIITFSGGLASGYAPARFLPANVIRAKLKPSAILTLAGYGITSPPSSVQAAGWQGAGTLRKVNVQLVQIGGQKIDMYLQGQTGHIACEGDSGGPAILTISGNDYVVGVDSRGNCQDTAIYGIVSQEMVQSFLGSVSN